MKEISDNGTITRLGSTVSGSWKAVDDLELGASSSYLFTAGLENYDPDGMAIVENPDGKNESRVELQFYLFDSATNISVGDLAFDALPSFAKFSIRLFGWQWASPADHIELRMKITPSFINFTRTSQAGLTTFVLTNQNSSRDNTKTQLRLIDSIELDGKQVRDGVTFDLDASRSELVLHFAYFNSTLEYDPGTVPVSDHHDHCHHAHLSLPSHRSGCLVRFAGQGRWQQRQRQHGPHHRRRGGRAVGHRDRDRRGSGHHRPRPPEAEAAQAQAHQDHEHVPALTSPRRERYPVGGMALTLPSFAPSLWPHNFDCPHTTHTQTSVLLLFDSFAPLSYSFRKRSEQFPKRFESYSPIRAHF
jgi:hypothetical protein